MRGGVGADGRAAQRRSAAAVLRGAVPDQGVAPAQGGVTMRESDYITGELPAEMAVPEAAGLIEPTQVTPVVRRVMTPAGLTIPIPARLPSAPISTNAEPYLSWRLALLPGVQCELTLSGESVAAEHLEQLIELLAVQVRAMRKYAVPVTGAKQSHTVDAD